MAKEEQAGSFSLMLKADAVTVVTPLLVPGCSGQSPIVGLPMALMPLDGYCGHQYWWLSLVICIIQHNQGRYTETGRLAPILKILGSKHDYHYSQPQSLIIITFSAHFCESESSWWMVLLSKLFSLMALGNFYWDVNSTEITRVYFQANTAGTEVQIST